MRTILTGIQSTGKMHLGNYLGAIKPAIQLSKTNNTILFIADIHSLTTIRDAKFRLENTYSLVAAIVSLGYDFKKNILFKQSDISEVSELSFYLSCLTPFNTLQKAHAFKEKGESDANIGLFTYPILMASDILLYGTDLVPVGKDQLQHLEITRDLANKFNNLYGKTFTIPEPYFYNTSLQTVPGIDGRKMSKSYNNYIDPFMEEKKLKKVIFSIVTSSVGKDDPKDYTDCNLFKLFSLFAFESEIEDLKKQYENGVLYSVVKQTLFEKIMEEFNEERYTYDKIINERSYLDSVLISGKLKAKEIASQKIKEIKIKLGL